jgi:hypothetical protein
MKPILKVILMGVAVLLVNSSCATAPKGPLGEGELRLLSIEVPDNGNLKVGIQYWVGINFEADGNPEIKRACFYWSGDGPYCVNVNGVKYTLPHGYFQVPLRARAVSDSNRLEYYAEYIREGKRQRTNSVSSSITVF